MKKEDSTTAMGTTKIELSDVINTDIIRALYMLTELKGIYYKYLEEFGKERKINYEIWAKGFNDCYNDIWCEYENLVGLMVRSNIDK